MTTFFQTNWVADFFQDRKFQVVPLANKEIVDVIDEIAARDDLEITNPNPTLSLRDVAKEIAPDIQFIVFEESLLKQGLQRFGQRRHKINIINCNENETETATTGATNGKFFAMVVKNKPSDFELVLYNGVSLFEFQNLPRSVQTMYINCNFKNVDDTDLALIKDIILDENKLRQRRGDKTLTDTEVDTLLQSIKTLSNKKRTKADIRTKGSVQRRGLYEKDLGLLEKAKLYAKSLKKEINPTRASPQFPEALQESLAQNKFLKSLPESLKPGVEEKLLCIPSNLKGKTYNQIRGIKAKCCNTMKQKTTDFCKKDIPEAILPSNLQMAHDAAINKDEHELFEKNVKDYYDDKCSTWIKRNITNRGACKRVEKYFLANPEAFREGVKTKIESEKKTVQKEYDEMKEKIKDLIKQVNLLLSKTTFTPQEIVSLSKNVADLQALEFSLKSLPSHLTYSNLTTSAKHKLYELVNEEIKGLEKAKTDGAQKLNELSEAAAASPTAASPAAATWASAMKDLVNVKNVGKLFGLLAFAGVAYAAFSEDTSLNPDYVPYNPYHPYSGGKRRRRTKRRTNKKRRTTTKRRR